MAEASGLSRVRRRRARPDRARPASGPASCIARPRSTAGVRHDHPRHRRERHDRRRPRPRSTALDAGRTRPPATSTLEVACDVSNPLLGPDGAAAIYGPQKGATPAQVDRPRRAQRRAGPTTSRRATGRRERDTPGAGAAGGVGFAPARRSRTASGRSPCAPASTSSWRRPTSTPSSPRADLVITGEGRIDAQTAFGKTALGVARRAQAAGVPCIAVGGGVEPEGIEALAAVGAIAVPGHRSGRRPSRRRWPPAPRPLERCGERLARLVGRRTATVPMAATSRDPKPSRSRARRSASSRIPRARTRSGSSATGPAWSAFVLDAARRALRPRAVWERRLDPTSELILTILTQNSADTNAEVAFQALREAYPSGLPSRRSTCPASAGAASACRTARRRTGRRSSSRRSPS